MLRFCISTETVDRELDKIALAGWDLTQYRNNPVVLWAHDAQRLPIGRAMDVGVVNGRLMASVKFVPPDMPEAGGFAEAVFRMAKDGWLGATSVGFRPIKWDYTNDETRGADDWFPGIDFEEQELVELSIVTVPANPEALIEGPGEGTAIASDTPPVTGEEVTGLSADWANGIQAAIAAEVTRNEERKRQQARRRRVLQLALATQY